MLDNVEPDQADSSSNKKQRLGNVQGVDQRQRNRQSAFPAPAQDKPEPTSSSDTAEEAPGWGEGQVPDDWGWGLDNPTLAAAAGSYESELQAQLSASSATYSQPQSAASPVAGDDVEPEDDWDDDMAAGSDVPDPTPDVTVLSRSEAVSQAEHDWWYSQIGLAFLMMFSAAIPISMFRLTVPPKNRNMLWLKGSMTRFFFDRHFDIWFLVEHRWNVHKQEHVCCRISC